MKRLTRAGTADAALGVLSHFRVEFYDCPYSRAGALFELTDAVLYADGPVKTLVELSLAVEHRRGHGALYAALDRGWLEPTRLRCVPAGLSLPKAADGRIVLAVDVSHWLRPDAPTSGDRLFCQSTDAATAARPVDARLALLLHRGPGVCFDDPAFVTESVDTAQAARGEDDAGVHTTPGRAAKKTMARKATKASPGQPRHAPARVSG